jgi:hypothetical protein
MFDFSIVSSTKSPGLRRVILTTLGRKVELTSFQGGPVEVYLFTPEGLALYQGGVASFAPGAALRATLRAAWRKAQPSAAAMAAFGA